MTKLARRDAALIGRHAKVIGGDHIGLLGQIIGFGGENDEQDLPKRALLRHRDGRKWKTAMVDFKDLQLQEEAA